MLMEHFQEKLNNVDIGHFGTVWTEQERGKIEKVSREEQLNHPTKVWS